MSNNLSKASPPAMVRSTNIYISIIYIYIRAGFSTIPDCSIARNYKFSIEKTKCYI